MNRTTLTYRGQNEEVGATFGLWEPKECVMRSTVMHKKCTGHCPTRKNTNLTPCILYTFYSGKYKCIDLLHISRVPIHFFVEFCESLSIV